MCEEREGGAEGEGATAANGERMRKVNCPKDPGRGATRGRSSKRQQQKLKWQKNQLNFLRVELQVALNVRRQREIQIQYLTDAQNPYMNK